MRDSRESRSEEVLVHQFVVRLVMAAACVGVLADAHPAAFRARGTTDYIITQLGSLGGTSSRGDSINDLGWIAGFSNVAGDASRHAALWINHSPAPIDLGTLGGPNSSVVWPVKDHRGIIVGISQTAMPDPFHESWSCSAFLPAATATGFQCVGFVWFAGVMRQLPTLGGTHGFATGVNDEGQVVGWAENTVHDPTCVAPQVLQFRAVEWQPITDRIVELPLIPGDTSSAATAINDRGQIVGISGICDQAVGRFTAAHAVLWDRGDVTDIGNLGGVTWNTPMAINERGDVAGFGSQAGDDPNNPNLLAFFWTKRRDRESPHAHRTRDEPGERHQHCRSGGRHVVSGGRALQRVRLGRRADVESQRSHRRQLSVSPRDGAGHQRRGADYGTLRESSDR
jgi:probable HAF family extracellular repeat protein